MGILRGKATPRIPKEAGEAKGRWQGKVAVSWEGPLRWHSSLEPACRFYVNMNGFLKRDASGKSLFAIGYEVRAANWDNTGSGHTLSSNLQTNTDPSHLQSTFLISGPQVPFVPTVPWSSSFRAYMEKERCLHTHTHTHTHTHSLPPC